MRHIHSIVIHYSATNYTTDFDVHDVTAWHLQRGFNDVGYHYIVKLDGTIQSGRPLDKVGAHVKGKNTGTIGICYIGGLISPEEATDTRTQAQKMALRYLVASLRTVLQRDLKVVGHNDLANTLCPGFSVTSEAWPMTFKEL